MLGLEARLRAFSDLARATAGTHDEEKLLRLLVDHARAVLELDGASVALAGGGDVLTLAAATDPAVAGAAERQLEARRGPGHEAFQRGIAVAVSDVEADERWPDVARSVRHQGFRSLAGVPMSVAGRRLGAVSLYARTPHTWRSEELAVAQVLADVATSCLVHVRALTDEQRVTAQLQHALDSRVVIEQAKGIVAGRRCLSTSEAFERLRRHARDHNRPLRLVAAMVVSGELVL